MISIRFRDVAFNILEDVSIQVTNDGDQNIITLEELEHAVKIAQISYEERFGSSDSN